jgi:hypothetical protein
MIDRSVEVPEPISVYEDSFDEGREERRASGCEGLPAVPFMRSAILTRREMERIRAMGDGEEMEEGEDLKLE